MSIPKKKKKKEPNKDKEEGALSCCVEENVDAEKEKPTQVMMCTL